MPAARPFIILAAISLFSFPAFAQQTARNYKTEQAIADRLASRAPQAVDLFQRATAAMDSGNYQEAIPLFQQVLQQAPLFTPAMRRLGASLAGSGQIDEGISYSRRAVKLERSAENLASLATVLAFPAPNQQGSTSQMQSAFLLAKEASDKYTGEDDANYLLLVAQLALNLKDIPAFHSATETLVQRHPELFATHYLNAIGMAMDENWVGSEDEIKVAEQMGMPKQAAEAFLASGIRKRAIIWRCLHYAPYLIGAWILGLALLFLVGKVLSSLTLRLIEALDPSASLSPSERLMRWYYRKLIIFVGAFYYVSLPLVIALVLGLAGSIIYSVLMIGYVPIKLVVILAIGAVVTVVKMVQALFVKADDSQPGRPLGRENAPDLWNLTREVAEKLGTRSLDQIRITTGTEMAVYERGTRQERRRDEGQRTLLMGIGLMHGFSQNAFRAILAHEYGHLSHRDTAGGEIALRVNRDMTNFAVALASARQALPWNLAFQFLRLYHFLFRRISHGAARLQEVLADRASAAIYGAQAFEEGLRHVVRRQIEFRKLALNEVRVSREAGVPFRNIYRLTSERFTSLDDEVEKTLHRQASEDDTHPSPADRFRLVRCVPCSQPPAAKGVMWDLFRDPEALTREMTSEVEYQVKGQLALQYPALTKS
jgi:Zn-dependent protease with chaperone function